MPGIEAKEGERMSEYVGEIQKVKNACSSSKNDVHRQELHKQVENMHVCWKIVKLQQS